jgi:exportin-2 (importin alpha re-exporter)
LSWSTGTEAAAGAGDEDQEDALEELAGAGYTAAYAKLANAYMPDRPVLSEIADPKQFAESSLASFMSRMGGGG